MGFGNKGHMGIQKLIAIAAVCAIAMALCGLVGCGGSSSGSSQNKGDSEKTEKVNYKAYKVDKLMSDLDKNAASAQEKYKDKNVALTGKLSNIDASGDYIDLVPLHDQFAIVGVQCYTHGDDKIVKKVKKLKKGRTYVVKGEITDVGEVLGYSLDIDGISEK